MGVDITQIQQLQDQLTPVVQDNGRAYLMGHDLGRGADCVLAKPVDQEKLIKCLAKVTNSHGPK